QTPPGAARTPLRSNPTPLLLCSAPLPPPPLSLLPHTSPDPSPPPADPSPPGHNKRPSLLYPSASILPPPHRTSSLCSQPHVPAWRASSSCSGPSRTP